MGPKHGCLLCTATYGYRNPHTNPSTEASLLGLLRELLTPAAETPPEQVQELGFPGSAETFTNLAAWPLADITQQIVER